MRRRTGPSGENSHARGMEVPAPPRAWRGASVVGVWKAARAPHSGQRSRELDRGTTASQIVQRKFMAP